MMKNDYKGHKMTEQTNRYANGKIYKLVNNVDDKIYVGSTCLTLCKRLYNHKQKSTKEQQRYVYSHFNSIGWDNVSIVLIEEHSCDNKNQLVKRERHWCDELKPQLNMLKPFRTYEEIREQNNLSRAKWIASEENRVKDNIRKKIYKDQHREEVRAKGREYYYANRDKQEERKGEKVQCPHCILQVRRDYLKKHIAKMHPST